MDIIARPSTARAGLRLAAAIVIAGTLAACSGLGGTRNDIEPLVPAEELYQNAVTHIEADRPMAGIAELERIERQHPFSPVNEQARVKLAETNYQLGRYGEAVRASDRFLALYPNSTQAPYVLFIKGSSYYRQITDITRDQEFASDAIETFTQLQNRFPSSPYAAQAQQMVLVARDQEAGKEMSVGRYYLGNGQQMAAINRFRAVVEDHQTSTHVEEALYRLIEAYLAVGLVGEAQTAGAVLGTNYPNSEWYQRGFTLLRNQGLAPQMMTGTWMTA